MNSVVVFRAVGSGTNRLVCLTSSFESAACLDLAHQIISLVLVRLARQVHLLSRLPSNPWLAGWFDSIRPVWCPCFTRVPVYVSRVAFVLGTPLSLASRDQNPDAAANDEFVHAGFGIDGVRARRESSKPLVLGTVQP